MYHSVAHRKASTGRHACYYKDYHFQLLVVKTKAVTSRKSSLIQPEAYVFPSVLTTAVLTLLCVTE
jgi:hypothetical protein